MRQVLQGKRELHALFNLVHRSQALFFLPLGRLEERGIPRPLFILDLHVLQCLLRASLVAFVSAFFSGVLWVTSYRRLKASPQKVHVCWWGISSTTRKQGCLDSSVVQVLTTRRMTLQMLHTAKLGQAERAFHTNL